jgi:FKBP-type peptidyl-prolyl cis-trans isomerase|tara:strand:+ start:452 stop:619 length:168 start_codon:yes stop_codon:yes gene_type:complete
LHNGDKATIKCPSKFAYGSAFTPAPIGMGAPIPENSDITYDVEILDCEVKPVFTK